uniref:magnesium transporter n=1 Tax=Thaumasiovibrio occultus TaxID=1891184 RepID=UPI000B34B18D|nr:magnesium transporter [Thaumasiovibrio occultus]
MIESYPLETMDILNAKLDALLNDQSSTSPPADTERQIKALIDAEPPSHISQLLRGLSLENAARFWRLSANIDSVWAADLLDHLPDFHIAALLAELTPALAAALLCEMESDDRHDVVSLLPLEQREGVLAHLPREMAAALRQTFSPNSAGDIMKTEMLRFEQKAKVADVVELLRTFTAHIEHVEQRYVYLYDQRHRFAGAVPLRHLLLADGQRSLASLVDPNVPSVVASMALSALKSEFDHVRYSVLPVLDTEGRQIGIIDYQDLQEALFEQAERELMEQGGILGGEELRSMALWPRIFRRLAFILPSVALSYAAVSVIALYEPVLDELVILAAFLPLVANLSGAAGNQAVAVSIRELSVDRLTPRSIGYVIWKELPIGICVGVFVGVILGLLSMLRSNEPMLLPLVVGVAYAVSSVLAVMLGGCLPLVIKRAGMDPAMLASPVLTTLTDAIAFFFVLFIAQGVLL